MKRQCKCGEIHNFQRFRSYETTFGGRTSHYQHFCQKLQKLMVLTTTTFPPSMTFEICPNLKKYKSVSTLQDSESFVNSLFCLAAKEGV